MGSIIPTKIKSFVRKSGERAGETGYNVSFVRRLPRNESFISPGEVFKN